MNKRRFRKSLSQNAIYMKYKRLVPITSSAAGANSLFTFNFNGAERTPLDQFSIMHQYDTVAQTLTSYNVSANMADLSGIYDQNRCAAVKIKWLPSVPPGSLSATSYQPQLVLRDRDGIDFQMSGRATSNTQSFQEQINGVKTLNVFRPWKIYVKALKHRINSRIPTETPSYATPVNGYSPNTNLSGQWKRTDASLCNSWDISGATPVDVNRGSQIAVVTQRPDNITGAITLGHLEVTTYYVYKDRN